jgi:small G protein signaling modulator 3
VDHSQKPSIATTFSDSTTSSIDVDLRDDVSESHTARRTPVGEWMGAWWTKGNYRFPSIFKDARISGKLEDATVTPNLVSSKQNARASAKSVFEAQTTSNRATSAGVVSPIPGQDDATTPSPKLRTTSPLPAAPQLTTSLEPQLLSDSATLSVGSPPSDTIILRQGSSLRGIIDATRVMTADPSSVLADQGSHTSELIANLALTLVRNVRDEGIVYHRPPGKEQKNRQTANADTSQNIPKATLSTIDGGEALTLARAIRDHAEKPKKPKSRPKSINAHNLPSPILSSFLSPQPRRSSDVLRKMTGGVQDLPSSASRSNGNTVSAGQPSVRKAAGHVPLESIIPVIAKPPTHYLSRTYTPLTSRNFHFTIPLPTSARFNVYLDQENQKPLTDRYGFTYDVSKYDVLLLLRAKESGNTSPACLTGVRIADREESTCWHDGADEGEQVMEIVEGPCDCSGGSDARSTNSVQLDSRSRASSVTSMRNYQWSRTDSPSPTRNTHRVSSARSPIVQNIAPPLSSVLSVTPATPRHACINTVRKLLEELSETHDRVQARRLKEWDTFAKLRSKTKSLKLSTPSVLSGGGSAAAILGLGTTDDDEELTHTEGLVAFAQLGLSANRDERKEFDRLVRGGIPLVYRSKVWLECSGGLEMREPGIFQDLLAQVETYQGAAAEIEKDVSRTMPLNVFFGGDGPGVDKLRRILLAYSRYGLSLVKFWEIISLSFLVAILPLDIAKA